MLTCSSVISSECVTTSPRPPLRVGSTATISVASWKPSAVAKPRPSEPRASGDARSTLTRLLSWRRVEPNDLVWLENHGRLFEFSLRDDDREAARPSVSELRRTLPLPDSSVALARDQRRLSLHVSLRKRVSPATGLVKAYPHLSRSWACGDVDVVAGHPHLPHRRARSVRRPDRPPNAAFFIASATCARAKRGGSPSNGVTESTRRREGHRGHSTASPPNASTIAATTSPRVTPGLMSIPTWISRSKPHRP